MGKLRKPGPATKTRIFEATTRQTRRGPRLINVPVQIPQTPQTKSRTSSPSKKRAWSPDAFQGDYEHEQSSDPDPKRSRHTGKVRHNLEIPAHLFNSIQQTQNDYLRQYLEKRQELLIEVLRHESPPVNRTCIMCHSAPGMYRCRDCFRPDLLCDGCCVSVHITSPFHRIQRFNGDYFERSDLDDIGLVLELCEHTDNCGGMPQSLGDMSASEGNISDGDADDSDNNELPTYYTSEQNRSPRSNIIVVSSTGIYKRSVTWCRCANSPERYVQLLRAKLFPASFERPETAFTFDVLDSFRIDALECKTAALNFMNKIGRISNEAFPSRNPVRVQIYYLELSS